MVNLSAFAHYHARLTPDRTAVVYGDLTISWRDFAERIGRLAALLHARGVAPGDRVAACMKNAPAFLDLAFACSQVGAVFLPVNYRLAAAEIEYILANAEAKLLFADEELAAQTQSFAPRILLDDRAQRDSRALAPDGAAPPPIAMCRPDDLFRLMYTSGTTDRPKGVMHSYSNLYWKCMDHVVALGLTSADRLAIAGPLYHVGAFDLPGIAVLWVGGMVSILRDFDPAAFLGAVERDRLTGAWLAPVMLSRALALDGRARYDLSSLRWCIGGGERTPEPRIRAFAGLFPKARYIDAYGLTESCSGDTFMEPGREIEKIGSTGRATPHVALSIRDERGAEIAAGQEGEICLRGPKVTRGYWRDEEKTRASFWGDWFRTGDVGHLDAEGFLYLTDRKKDMIKSGGENIASSEVERVVYMLPEIAEAAAIGVPDERWGERPVVVAVLREGAALTADDLQAHCRQHLAGFKVPKELHLRTVLPRNPSGKVLKRVLREELARGP
ncbi:MAG: AMP-binding protein [Alphaproteobacteria bacterium]|nr:AMP-binding protein [Alphaproteobacteria bacterium]